MNNWQRIKEFAKRKRWDVWTSVSNETKAPMIVVKDNWHLIEAVIDAAKNYWEWKRHEPAYCTCGSEKCFACQIGYAVKDLEEGATK